MCAQVRVCVWYTIISRLLRDFLALLSLGASLASVQEAETFSQAQKPFLPYSSRGRCGHAKDQLYQLQWSRGKSVGFQALEFGF